MSSFSNQDTVHEDTRAHNSNIANTIDPRVDSTREHASAPRSSNMATHGEQQAYTGAPAGENYTYSTPQSYETGGATAGTGGPHKSNLMNKADPRVDSDRDNSKNMGFSQGTGRDSMVGTSGGTTTGVPNQRTAGYEPTAATGSTTAPTGPSYGAASQSLHGTQPPVENTTATEGPGGTYGSHHTRTANTADPRVDSGPDGGRNMGAARTSETTGYTGVGASQPAAGYSSTAGQQRSSEGYTSSGDPNQGFHAAGPAPSTAGPHKSDMLNKADPRVDSDLDGSKTYGGNKTYAGTARAQ